MYGDGIHQQHAATVLHVTSQVRWHTSSTAATECTVVNHALRIVLDSWLQRCRHVSCLLAKAIVIHTPRLRQPRDHARGTHSSAAASRHHGPTLGTALQSSARQRRSKSFSAPLLVSAAVHLYPCQQPPVLPPPRMAFSTNMLGLLCAALLVAAGTTEAHGESNVLLHRFSDHPCLSLQQLAHVRFKCADRQRDLRQGATGKVHAWQDR